MLGFYLDPPEHAVVLSIEERQALDRTQPSVPPKPGSCVLDQIEVGVDADKHLALTGHTDHVVPVCNVVLLFTPAFSGSSPIAEAGV